MENIKNSRFTGGLVWWFVCCLSVSLTAQSVQLKKPLTEEDNKFLKKQLLEFFAYQTSLECNYFNYGMNDLAPIIACNSRECYHVKEGTEGKQAGRFCLFIDFRYIQQA